MFDIFDKYLSKFPLINYFDDFDASLMNELEFIKKKFLDIRSENITVFITDGFNFERNSFLVDLLLKKLRGDELEEFYPYKHLLKPLVSPKLVDVKFCFT